MIYFALIFSDTISSQILHFPFHQRHQLDQPYVIYERPRVLKLCNAWQPKSDPGFEFLVEIHGETISSTSESH